MTKAVPLLHLVHRSFPRVPANVASVGKAGVGILAPVAALEANPIANAVAVVSLEDINKSGVQVTLPEGAIRLAVSIEVGFDVMQSIASLETSTDF